MKTVSTALCGFGLDLLLGDPAALTSLHPVVLMGREIRALEGKLRARFPETAQGERLAGAVLAAVVPTGTYLASRMALRALNRRAPAAAFLLETLWSWQVLAGSLSEQVFRGPVPAEPVLQRVKVWNAGLIPLLDRAVLRTARRRVLFGFEHDPASPVEGAFQGLQDVQGLSAGQKPADSLGLSAEQELSAGQEPPVRLSHLADLTWPFSPSRGRYYTMRILDLWKEDVT